MDLIYLVCPGFLHWYGRVPPEWMHLAVGLPLPPALERGTLQFYQSISHTTHISSGKAYIYHNKFDWSSSLHIFYGYSTGTIRLRKSPKETYIGSSGYSSSPIPSPLPGGAIPRS